jgi:hypothetical protein
MPQGIGPIRYRIYEAGKGKDAPLEKGPILCYTLLKRRRRNGNP